VIPLVAVALLGSSSPQDSAVKLDLEKFQGNWQATLVVNVNGESAPQDQVRDTQLKVEGTKFVLRSKDAVVKGTFTIDPSRTPKTIDVVLEGQNPNEKLLGIYRIDGDERRSCFALPGKDRPKDFDPCLPGYIAFTWKFKTR